MMLPFDFKTMIRMAAKEKAFIDSLKIPEIIKWLDEGGTIHALKLKIDRSVDEYFDELENRR